MSDVENDGRGKWQRLAWSDDVMAVMNDPEVAKLSAKDAADVLNKLFPRIAFPIVIANQN